ncbi:MAG: hypothetical protein HY794_12930, partial [Desulfarculus sp.]|nr:hypothetical protein [Desulfarculus sp.]
AQQRLAASPQAVAVAVSPEVWPVLGEALAPAARQAGLDLAGAWPAALAEAAALWQAGAPAQPAHYLHLHAGGQALHADLVRLSGQDLGLLASAQVPAAGVEAMREALVQWALQRVRQDMGLDGQSQPRFLAALRNTAEMALGDLERFGSGCLVVMGGLRSREGEILDLELDLDLNDYRQLARPGLEAAAREVGRLLRGAGLDWAGLAQVGLRLGGLEAALLRQLLEDGGASSQSFLPLTVPGQASALAAASLATANPWRISLATAPEAALVSLAPPPPPSGASPPPEEPAAVSTPEGSFPAGQPQEASPSQPSQEESSLELVGEGTDLLPAGASGDGGPHQSQPEPSLLGSSLAGESQREYSSATSTDPGAEAAEDPSAPAGMAEPEPRAWMPGDSQAPEPSPPLDLAPQEPAQAPAADDAQGQSSWRAPSAPRPPEQPQTVAQRYLILEIKARESYASLYRARDLQSGGTVLLKLFATNKEPAKQAFARALTARHIRHPNLDAILDLGPHGRGMFITLADEGRVTVREVMRRGQPASPLPLPQALRVMLGLGEALRAIHLIQLSHRNVKPDKVRVREHGPGLWLGGFELCQFTPPGLRVQAAAGTPNYMAPEVWRGEPGCASDIFAAAVFFYEMLTGRLPFWGRDPRQLEEAIRSRRPLPPREHNRTLPPEMDELVLRGLAKDPRARVLDWAALRALKNSLDNNAQA